MASPPPDFGKRKPSTPAVASPPVKRSRHVALLLTGTLAVGGTAYAVMPPRQNCGPASPAASAAPSPPISGMTAPMSPTPVTSCGSGGGHGGGGSGGWWSHSNYYGGSSSAGNTSWGGFNTNNRGRLRRIWV